MHEETLQQELLKPEYIINAILRRRWLLILPLILALAAGSYLAITLPKIYETETLILVEPQRVPANYVQSIVPTNVEERIDTLSQQILSRTNLEKIIDQFGLFSGPGYETMFQEDKVEALRQSITVQVSRNRRETNAFSISFQGKSPEMAMNITNALAAVFIDENLKAREAQAVGTSDFLEAELNNTRKSLEEQEKELQAFRTDHMGELPEQLETNLRILDRLQGSLTERQESLRDARSRLANLQNQASAGLLTDQGRGETGAREPDPLDPTALRAELVRLQTRYTDQHPDIIKIKKQIEDLEAQGISAGSGDASHRHEPLQIGEVRRQIGHIESDIDRIQAEIAYYQRRVELTPKLEQELMALQRDYDNLQASYSSLLNRKLEADISVNMERKQKGEQFRILDPAHLPERPISPNMRRLFLMTIAVGLGIGGGLIFLLEFMYRGFRSPKEVEIALGLPTIALIPYIEDRKTQLFKTFNWTATGIALVATCLLFILFAALTFKGVDVTLAFIENAKDIFI